MTLTPRPYQIIGRDFLMQRPRAYLADQMRVGKSPQAILAADALGAQNVLVACPAIACEHWKREWAKWSPSRSEARILSPKTAPARGVLVASYNMLTRYQDVLRGADVFIVDEAHFAKTPTAARARAVFGSKGLIGHSGATWALSGTPAPKHAGELWTVLRAFDRTDMSYYAFTDRYCWFTDRLTRKIGGTRKDRAHEIVAMLDPVLLRRTRAEVAPDMPEIDFQMLELDIEARHAPIDLPTVADDELLAWLEGHSEQLQEFRRWCAGAKANALAEQIIFAIENGLLEQTVVFGHYVDPLEDLTKALRRANIKSEVINGSTPQGKRVEIQDAFRAGELQVVCANIQTAGTAIDLSAARHGFFLELDWTPGSNAQAASRLVSMAKLDKVTMDVCTWPGSPDDRVQQVLRRRTSELSYLF